MLTFLGETSLKISEEIGESRYNFKISYEWPFGQPDENGKMQNLNVVELGVILDGGRRCYLKGMAVYNVEKITDEELKAIEDDYDPIEAPPGPYKIQPEVKGKLVWLSGAPGMGKSTSAQILGRDFGYVYYEADCFGVLKNPFTDLSVDNPSMVSVKQKYLKGRQMPIF